MADCLRIIVADDHLIFRQGLTSLLKHEPDCEIVAEAARADELPALLDRIPCDLLLLDLQLERSALPDIEALAARIPIVVLTASELAGDALAAIRLGARAVVLKRFAVETLIGAIRDVAAGNVWLPPNLQTLLAQRLRNPLMNALSPREEEVVRSAALGLRNAEIGRRLFISEQTVKTHLNNIFQKLGVRDRTGLTVYAIRAGIVGLHERL